MMICNNKDLFITNANRVPEGGLVGYVICSYDQLEKILGKPTYYDHEDFGKVQVEWVLTEKDIVPGKQTVLQIYDWKLDYDISNVEYRYLKYAFHVGSPDSMVAYALIGWLSNAILGLELENGNEEISNCF